MCSESSGTGRAVVGLAVDDVVPPDVAARRSSRCRPRGRRRGAGRRGRARSSGVGARASSTAGLSAAGLPRRQPPSAVMTSFASASLMRSGERLGGEPAEDDRVRGADPGAGEHRDRQLRDHRHVDRDAVAGPDAELLERVGRLLDLAQEVRVGERPRVARLADPVVGDLVAEAVRDVAVDAVVADVQLAAGEPLGERQVPLERRRGTARTSRCARAPGCAQKRLEVAPRPRRRGRRSRWPARRTPGPAGRCALSARRFSISVEDGVGSTLTGPSGGRGWPAILASRRAGHRRRYHGRPRLAGRGSHAASTALETEIHDG